MKRKLTTGRKFTLAWVLWALAFIVIEGLALKRESKGDTLSEHVWWAASNPPVWWTLAGFMLWLTGHFLLRAKGRGKGQF